MDDSKVNLHDTIDARVWTRAWLITIAAHPGLPTDEGAMLGWFANAIMAGYDKAMCEVKDRDRDGRVELK